MKLHHLAAEQALASLHTRPEGLSGAEAQRRLREFGPNRIEEVRGEPLARRLARSFTHFFALILWVAAGLAFFAETHAPGEGMAVLGAAIIAVIVINGVFSFWQEYRAEQALSALRRLIPHEVQVRRDGSAVRLPAAALVPGDVIFLAAGDDVPADCRLIQAFGVRVNTATITGDAVAMTRDAQPDREEEPLHSRNLLFAGTALVAGEAEAVVFATGMHTEFGKIAHLTQTTGEALSPLQKEIVGLSRLVALLAGALGATFFLVGRWIGLSFWDNLIFAVGILVANVPEGLLPTVTLTLALSARRMAARNALIRHLPSVETLGSATVICTDKTGTLTQNRMAVRTLFLGEAFHGVDDAAQLAALQQRYPRFFEDARLCHTVQETRTDSGVELLGDPTEVALVQMAQRTACSATAYPRLDEIPFDPDRRRLSTVHATPAGLVLYSKGALEALLPLCRWVQLEQETVPLTAALKERFLQAQGILAEQGLRVLAFAWRTLPQAYERERLEEELILLGLVGLEDPPRPEVPAALQKCRTAGIKVIMVTGDHPQTATAVARQIGLVHSDHPVVLTGAELRRLSDAQLQLVLDAPEILFARIGADQKMRIVRALKRKQQIVAVTGDGVNDAPALREANIGIAMGRTGTDVAKAAADMILLDDNFATIVAAIEEGRGVYANIRKFLTYILTSNVPEIVPYLAFVLFKIPLPLTVIQILAVDLGTDMVPALALGAEPPDPRLMQQPPRPRREHLLNRPLLLRAYLFLGVLEAAAAMAAYFFVLYGAGWRYGEPLRPTDPLYLQATAACLATIIVMQMANVFLCRSPTDPALAGKPLQNRLLLGGLATELSLILAIVYTPLGNLLFGTAPLPSAVWALAAGFTVAMFFLEETRKWLLRSRSCRPLNRRQQARPTGVVEGVEK